VSTILHPVAATRRRRARCGADISPSAIPASSARVCRVSNMLCGIAIDGTAGWTRYQPALALRLSTRVPKLMYLSCGPAADAPVCAEFRQERAKRKNKVCRYSPSRRKRA
jgi:hypothetical protein